MHKNIHISADEAKVLYNLLECPEQDIYCQSLKKKLEDLMMEQTIEATNVEMMWDIF
ncbi:MAG: hypothetical protein OEZ01_15975 [Candidatus Heimdallarchaeota archaeon]|nr:hypothetical protein [Candidatus Heimdallarchaeota archaeon]